MRGIGLILVSLSCSLMTGCVSTDTPETSDPALRISPSPRYLSEQKESFAVWQKNLREGVIPGDRIWDCPLCPKMRARLASGIWAGSAEWDPDRQPNEPPLASVDITSPYAMATHEVTRDEFAAFAAATNRTMKGGCHTDRMDSSAGFWNPGFEQQGDHPVVCVSRDDANAYVSWLNSQTSGGYRLPEEAEWHAGAFGGGYEIYSWGDEPEFACLYANILDAAGAATLPRDGALACSDGAAHTASVGRYLPGATQQFDVIGNAAEWTASCDPTEASGPRCSHAIVKGGSWKSTRIEMRSAARRSLPADFRDNAVGFRVARTLGDPQLPLKSANEYLMRGRQKLGLLDYGAAQADLERAAAMAPQDSHAISARGWVYFRTEKYELARRDFAAALALDQANAEAIAGLGVCALDDNKAKESVRLLDQALSLAPSYQMAKAIRATANLRAGNLDRALADTAEVLRVAPTDIELLKLRVHLRGMRQEWAEAAVEVQRLTRALPTLDSAQQFAASAYSALMLDDLATASATRAVSAYESSENYLLRATVRPWMDLVGRRADIEAALAFEPTSPGALAALGELESRVGNHTAASRAFTRLLEIDAAGERRSGGLVSRGIELYKLGDKSAAFKDFTEALGSKPGAPVLNDLCWHMMVAEVALDRAMTYCDQALKIRPREPAVLDSKAMLMLRLGRWSDAIRLFDNALAQMPELANSLYGRGIAKQSRCKCTEGSADLEEALRNMPSIQRNFERRGFVAPYPVAGINFHPQ